MELQLEAVVNHPPDSCRLDSYPTNSGLQNGNANQPEVLARRQCDPPWNCPGRAVSLIRDFEIPSKVVETYSAIDVGKLHVFSARQGLRVKI
jgi:hypothetical protein